MQSRNINGYAQEQYYGDDSSWMETKAQQLQSHGYPQSQQYPGMKPGYGKDSDYSMPNHHGHDSNHNMYHQQDSKPHGLDSYNMHYQDNVPHGQGNGYGNGYDNNNHSHGHGNGQVFPYGATTNHSPHHGNGVRPFKPELERILTPIKHGNGGHNNYESEQEYEVYKEERLGSGATKMDEMKYERRGTYGGDVHHANPYGYNNNNRNNPHGHGTNKANWTLKGV